MVPHSCMPRNLPWFHFIPHSAHLIHGNAVASTFKIYPESKHFSISLLIHSWLKTRLICLLELSSSWLSLRLPHGNWSDQSTNWILPCFCLITSCGFLINSLISYHLQVLQSPPLTSPTLSLLVFSFMLFFTMAFVLHLSIPNLHLFQCYFLCGPTSLPWVFTQLHLFHHSSLNSPHLSLANLHLYILLSISASPL